MGLVVPRRMSLALTHVLVLVVVVKVGEFVVLLMSLRCRLKVKITQGLMNETMRIMKETMS